MSGPRASPHRGLEGGAGTKGDPRGQRDTSFPVVAQPGPACHSSTEGVNTKARTVHATTRTRRPGNPWVHRAGCRAGAGATESARPSVRGREEQKQKEEELGRQREERGEAHGAPGPRPAAGGLREGGKELSFTSSSTSFSTRGTACSAVTARLAVVLAGPPQVRRSGPPQGPQDRESGPSERPAGPRQHRSLQQPSGWGRTDSSLRAGDTSTAAPATGIGSSSALPLPLPAGGPARH